MDSGVSILNFSTLETVTVKPKTLLFVMTSFAWFYVVDTLSKQFIIHLHYRPVLQYQFGCYPEPGLVPEGNHSTQTKFGTCPWYIFKN